MLTHRRPATKLAMLQAIDLKNSDRARKWKRLFRTVAKALEWRFV